MSRHLEEVRDMLCEELDEIAEKGELTAGTLDTVDKLTHSIKSIDTIMAMENSGYSYRYDDGHSYARKRDSMSRYSRDYDRRGGRYSYADGKDAMKEHLEMAMHEATDEKTRREIQRMIDGMM